MNKLLTKSNLLAATVSLSMLGFATTGATAATDAINKTDTRMAKMLEKSTEAAKATVSANQAVSIALKQVANANAVAVRYHDGTESGRLAKIFDTSKPSYHVLLIDAEGKRFHTQIDAATGKVLEVEEKQKPQRMAESDTDNKPPVPAINLTSAMQTAASSVGGEAVGAGFGHMGMKGKHGQHGHHGSHRHGKADGGNRGSNRAANKGGDIRNGERPDPSYHVRVLKGSEVYMVKVDGETGKVVDTKTMEELKQMREQMRQGRHDGMRGGRR